MGSGGDDGRPRAAAARPEGARAPDVAINEWGALATLSWDSATGTARLRIGEFAADRRFIVSGVAEAHIPKRGARASTIAFATLATPVTLAIDIVLTPVYLIAPIVSLAGGGQARGPTTRRDPTITPPSPLPSM